MIQEIHAPRAVVSGMKAASPRGFLAATLFWMMFLAAIGAGLWAAGLFAYAYASYNWSRPAQDLRLDAAVVLTGDSNRIDAGVDLLEQGRVQKLFISGVNRHVEVGDILAARDTGFSDKIVAGYNADDTKGNAAETVEWLTAKGYKGFFLVTSDYHMARALIEFGLWDHDFRVVPYPVASAGAPADLWWRSGETRSLTIREYNKLLAATVISIL